MKTTKILGVTISSDREKIILEYLFNRLSTSTKKTFIVTPNPEMVVYARKHLIYKDILNHADIALPDGIGLLIASKFLGEGISERISGIDFIEKLCSTSKEKPLSMGFLGGRMGVATRAAKCLKQRYPWINIAFAAEEWPQDFRLKMKDLRYKDSNEKGITSSILNHKSVDTIDILFVAYGVPKQEEWIYKNLEKLPVKAAMGVGGSFDFISGDVRRAPLIMRKLGIEWLFRLVIQPWRWRRQLALIEFIYFIIKERIS